MNFQINPESTYKERINELSTELNALKKRKNVIAWIRLLIIVGAIFTAYNLYTDELEATLIITAVLLVIFGRLIVLAVNNRNAIENITRLIAINEQELQIAAGNYTNLSTGSVAVPSAHDYANDLDIFGRASVFQYINRTTSQPGQDKLVQWLLQPSDAVTINDRQLAAKELSTYYKWRQQLQAHGMASAIQRTTEAKLAEWAGTKNIFITRSYWLWLRYILPLVILTISFLYLNDTVNSGVLAATIVVFFLISGLISRKISPTYQQLDKIVAEVNTLYNSIECAEGQKFESSLLKKHQEVFIRETTKASAEVKDLKLILDRMDFRVNPMIFVPVNTFLLWDLQQIIALEKWKDKNKEYLTQWIKALAEMEAISTLANMHFNHPAWVFPVLDTEHHGTFESTGLGHPLIPEKKMVYNNFSASGTGQVALITGSNMAGKSTFLRSIGVNMVLAMMGAPVCAKSMRLSPMRVVSSMRVMDNLEESTSTFYAELKKLRSIIEYVNNNEKVFVLLDEILRGTNSLDRHTGSKALVKQLINKNAVAILATHDVELAQLQLDYPTRIHNYHFDAQIENEELYFDYKLKEGICKSLNASILMKKIGIEL